MGRRYSINSSKFLDESEVERFELVCKRSLATHHNRNAVLLLLAIRTGARPTELLKLRVQDYNHSTRTLHIRGIKGSNDREIPIPSWLAVALKRHLQDVTTERIFPISYWMFREIWCFYRPVKKPLHSLRHTFAISLYQRTKDIRLVMTALGHRNIANTLIYVDYVYSQQELKRIVF